MVEQRNITSREIASAGIDYLIQLQNNYYIQGGVNISLEDIASGKASVGQVEARINGVLTALVHEVEEMRDCVQWKWWKPTMKFKKGEAKEELIDILHFVLSLCILLEMNGEQVVDMYLHKRAINIQRQKDPHLGYIKGNKTQ